METVLTEARHIPLEGARNVRDLGGYPTRDGGKTRWGVFYRADSLHALTDADVAALHARGIRSVIDLRREEEANHAPNVFASHESVAFLRVSLVGDGAARQAGVPSLATVYRTILDTRQEALAAVFERLLFAVEMPTVFHCTAGKDRTGIVAALLLSIADVEDEVIAEDFALTARAQVGAYWDEAKERAERAGLLWEDYQRLLICPPELMLETLAHIRQQHGGVPALLQGAGVAPETQAVLRTLLRGDGNS